MASGSGYATGTVSGVAGALLGLFLVAAGRAADAYADPDGPRVLAVGAALAALGAAAVAGAVVAGSPGRERVGGGVMLGSGLAGLAAFAWLASGGDIPQPIVALYVVPFAMVALAGVRALLARPREPSDALDSLDPEPTPPLADAPPPPR